MLKNKDVICDDCGTWLGFETNEPSWFEVKDPDVVASSVAGVHLRPVQVIRHFCDAACLINHYNN